MTLGIFYGDTFLPALPEKRVFDRIFVPEIKEELANNSFCLWVISESRADIEVEALRKSVPYLDINLEIRDITKSRRVGGQDSAWCQRTMCNELFSDYTKSMG